MSEKEGWHKVDHALDESVAGGVFPGGVLLAAEKGNILYHRGVGVTDLDTLQPVTGNTVYDLASLTKPLATALVMADLIGKGIAFCDMPLSMIIPETLGTDKADLTLDMLLRHTSGVPAHRKYFNDLPRWGGARTTLHRMLIQEPLEALPGQRECYSDLGYMFLAWAAENLSGQRLDQYVYRHIYAPLGITGLGFSPLDSPVPEFCRNASATMDCPWRGGVIRGRVEDENAWACGGVEGHAGLFGSAPAVLALCQEIMAAFLGKGRVLDPEVVRSFLTRYPGMTRTAGFDTPSLGRSAAGSYFPRTAVGHLGFTGTSFWMDARRQLVVILLTNRVHPSRENLKIRQFRPLIHDLVMGAIHGNTPV